MRRRCRGACAVLYGAVVSRPVTRGKRKPWAMKRAVLQNIAETAVNGTPADVAALLEQHCRARAWRKHGLRLARILRSGNWNDRLFSIFVRGNGKLPFWAFSTLPGVTCPGAGSCLSWCYSYKAWRYPAAFMRQLQNTLLLRSAEGRARIAAAWSRLPKGTTVRLYVDGDFDSLETLAFWFDRCRERADLNAYGYSKSWAIFIAYAARNAVPSNYWLNVSSGSLHDGDSVIRAALDRIAVTRGDFVAIETSTRANYTSKGKQQREHLAELRDKGRELFGRPVFACPGRCGTCTPDGHACGSERFKGVPIVIATHA